MREAARNTDFHVCGFMHPPVPTPHVGGSLTTGTRKVLVNGQEAATYGDESECMGIGSPAPKDSIKGGNLMVFIGGNPAARINEVTFGGSVLVGSPNVFHNDAPGPLSEAAANWLHQYLQQMQPEIPFNYPWDGCYWRAERMRQIMESQFGLPCQKIFVHGALKPVTGTLHGGAPVTWGYHVAPIVNGVDAQGHPTQYVMDPAMSPDTVLTKKEWLDVTKGNGSISRVSVQSPDKFATTGPGHDTTDKAWADPVIANYRNEVAHGHYADPDANLAGKVAGKDSFPHPVVHPPHVP